MRQPISFGSAAPWRLFPLKGINWNKEMEGINAEKPLGNLIKAGERARICLKQKINLQKINKSAEKQVKVQEA